MGRNRFPREFYIPKGSTKVQAKNSSAVAYVYTNAKTGRLGAVGFAGKADKPAFRYGFRDEKHRAMYVAEFFRQTSQREQIAQQRRAERKAEGRGLEVGDLLVRSWGYDQTNIDYWQVTGLVGKAMVEIRKIGAAVVETQSMQGDCSPQPGNFIGPAERRIAKGGRVKINHYAWAWKLQPKQIVAGVPVYGVDHWTSYA